MNDELLLFASLLLKTSFRPKDYQAILRKYSRGTVFDYTMAQDDYWGKLPNYLISRCPFCQAPYTSLLDTHGLHSGWSTSADRWSSIQVEHYQHIGCNHFTAVQRFVNLNGETPDEVIYFKNELDVPFIMPIFIPDDLDSIAVIHCVPICRIEHARFIPRYLACFVTYYALQPEELRRRRGVEITAQGRGDPEYRSPALYTAGDAKRHAHAYDLRRWVAKGKLRWIDSRSANLPLRNDLEDHFVYEGIQGYRQPILVQSGHIRTVL